MHLVQRTATEVLALSQAVTGLAPPPSGCLVTSNGIVYNVCPALTKLDFSGTNSNQGKFDWTDQTEKYM